MLSRREVHFCGPVKDGHKILNLHTELTAKFVRFVGFMRCGFTSRRQESLCLFDAVVCKVQARKHISAER